MSPRLLKGTLSHPQWRTHTHHTCWVFYRQPGFPVESGAVWLPINFLSKDPLIWETSVISLFAVCTFNSIQRPQVHTCSHAPPCWGMDLSPSKAMAKVNVLLEWEMVTAQPLHMPGTTARWSPYCGTRNGDPGCSSQPRSWEAPQSQFKSLQVPDDGAREESVGRAA